MPMVKTPDKSVMRYSSCGFNVIRFLGKKCPESGSHVSRNNATAQHYSKWLHRYAVLLVIATFSLVILGGTVTSKGAGLAVPDWPTSYGHGMFELPWMMWVGNIFWEHLHRLAGATVGILCIVMAAWLWVSQQHRPWLRWSGVGLLGLVILQGVMGGLRVTELSIALAIMHGVMGQLFLCLTVFIAAATSAYWTLGDQQAIGRDGLDRLRVYRYLGRFSAFFFVVLLIQLILGAAMRHSEAGLAIFDFPSAYGQLVPPFSQSGIAEATEKILDEGDTWLTAYFTPMQVAVHFSHRVWAIVVLAVGGWFIVRLSRHAVGQPLLLRPAAAITLMLIMQAALGAAVIWSGRHSEVATAHQALGAAILATSSLLLVRLMRLNLRSVIPSNQGEKVVDLQTSTSSSSLKVVGA